MKIICLECFKCNGIIAYFKCVAGSMKHFCWLFYLVSWIDQKRQVFSFCYIQWHTWCLTIRWWQQSQIVDLVRVESICICLQVWLIQIDIMFRLYFSENLWNHFPQNIEFRTFPGSKTPTRKHDIVSVEEMKNIWIPLVSTNISNKLKLTFSAWRIRPSPIGNRRSICASSPQIRHLNKGSRRVKITPTEWFQMTKRLNTC